MIRKYKRNRKTGNGKLSIGARIIRKRSYDGEILKILNDGLVNAEIAYMKMAERPSILSVMKQVGLLRPIQDEPKAIKILLPGAQIEMNDMFKDLFKDKPVIFTDGQFGHVYTNTGIITVNN